MKITSGWCGIERLEERRLLAGNVTAEGVGGNFIIEGDSNGNGIVLTAITRRSGPFRLSGDPSTTINGQSGHVDLVGVTGDVRIDLGAGKNSLEMERLRLPGKLVVNTGRSDDVVRAGTVHVDGVI